jgi:hypothetical protein
LPPRNVSLLKRARYLSRIRFEAVILSRWNIAAEGAIGAGKFISRWKAAHCADESLD